MIIASTEDLNSGDNQIIYFYLENQQFMLYQ